MNFSIRAASASGDPCMILNDIDSLPNRLLVCLMRPGQVHARPGRMSSPLLDLVEVLPELHRQDVADEPAVVIDAVEAELVHCVDQMNSEHASPHFVWLTGRNIIPYPSDAASSGHARQPPPVPLAGENHEDPVGVRRRGGSVSIGLTIPRSWKGE